jgi:TIR domain
VADIFISYAREDAVRAHALAEALADLGWSVWRDDSIRAGAPFDQVIDQQLDMASCVVVIWSTASVASNWVRAEASTADEQGKLVPVSFEHDLRLPVRFRQLNAAHLTSTDLREPSNGPLQLLADIAALTGKQPSGIEPSQIPFPDRRRSSGANVVTAGNWRITLRALGARATYDLTFHPNSTVTGTGRWTISRANVAGRWLFDPAGQILHLELSGGLEKGTRVIPVQIVRWNEADDADCMFEHRRAHLEKLPPAGR